eukprot:CAMPEP_0117426472 /NCGR_PEP_ID=MMETSP0758-20121206/6577_1 /TAXON_ID=63605 /ORGANISM="Percolomonas cosmopolitus, Strain AE-1 (ATCC 50343)" /LENGTH=67 /DNA_ID=CAMNT_0005211657 /DNA_START=1272 /DNA_END=1475 /DNA_ORIENTATION=+
MANAKKGSINTQRVKKGDVITMIFHGPTGTLKAQLNGTDVGTIASNILTPVRPCVVLRDIDAVSFIR